MPPSDTLLAARDVPLGTPERPVWRGRLHLFALFSVVPLLVILAVAADGARSRAGVIVYGVGLCATFAVSTTYHRWVHTIRARAAWRRADHATIFALIAGTFTPLALTTLDTGTAIALLIVIWGAAATCAVLKALGIWLSHRMSGAMYIATGWAGLVLLPALWRTGGAVPVALFVAGGIAYTVGAVGFGRRWPTLRPATFSYHEVWHAFTIAAAGFHFAVIWSAAA